MKSGTTDAGKDQGAREARPELHRLYRFVTVAAAGEEVDQEWDGWWSGRNWHALYDLGVWDPQFVVRWEPLAPLAPSPAATTGACSCGWGGVHDPDNPRCDANRPPVSSGEAGVGEAASQWEQMLRDPNDQFDVNGEVAQAILDAASGRGPKPQAAPPSVLLGVQIEAWQSGECGRWIEEPVQVTTASAKPAKPSTWIADFCGLPKGHDGDCVMRGDLPAPVVTPSAEGSE